MTYARTIRMSLCLSALLPWLGCVTKPPPPKPVVVAPPPVAPHIIGTWENQARDGSVHKMIFEPGGRLSFQGGLEFFNPGQWALDPARQELRLTFPQAADEKLQIFALYL